jgi:hypothetical protein
MSKADVSKFEFRNIYRSLYESTSIIIAAWQTGCALKVSDFYQQLETDWETP